MATFKIVDENLTMEDLLSHSADLLQPALGTVVEGTVISVRKNQLVVDLNGVAVGIVTGKDTQDTQGTFRDLKEGDTVKAVVIRGEDEGGNVVLSLRKASQATAWDRFEKAFRDCEIIEVTVHEANKGGLLLDVDGIKGFIPVSQLAPVHYPRVEGADSGMILTRLQKLVSQKLQVKVINLDRASGKMILSEKAAAHGDSQAALSSLTVGDRVKGKVSGVVKFGIFVTFNGLEGLVHISEIAWGHVSDPHEYAKMGQEVEVEIIGIEGDKLSLSIKRLTPDPWQEIADKYPVDSKVKGKISRFSLFGAFVELPDELSGLIHLSEVAESKVDSAEDYLEVGQEVEATVINIDRDEHRIGLSLKGMGLKKIKTTKKAKEEKEGEKEEVKAEEDPKKEEAKEEKPKILPVRQAGKKAAPKEEKEEKAEKKIEKKTKKKEEK
ncbi:MAG: S1 RNA-binding domain-containing protein [Candidatus Peregrinibacteria bacterium]